MPSQPPQEAAARNLTKARTERLGIRSMAAKRESGHAVVITGAAGGIGVAMTRRLLADGWRVVATDVQQEMLDRAADELGASDKLLPLRMDVADRNSVAGAAHRIGESRWKVAGLVNAAALLQDVFAFMNMDQREQRRLWDVNYFGAVTCTQVFGAIMAESGGGAIVNITSINELRPLPLHAYAPSKVALGALTTLTAGELGPAGIRVNAIAPGFTLTPILKHKIATGKRDIKVVADHTALGRLVEPDEIASVTSFLLSDDASAISGASIPVDAGWLTTSHWMNFREMQQPPGKEPDSKPPHPQSAGGGQSEPA
jgi:NAD(P)-dependent dehydrogenase (short-subunit alcohol dehydrogenase family)